MRLCFLLLLALFGVCVSLQADQVVDRARQMETSGDALEARRLLHQAAEESPGNLDRLTAYAEFLDRHNATGTRAAYEKLLASLPVPDDSGRRISVIRRLVLLNTLAGNQEEAAARLAQYHAAGGKDFSDPSRVGPETTLPESREYVEIPGPLKPFARMAAISADAAPDEVLAALARNVVVLGYRASQGQEAFSQTEFMKLLLRYLSQARELERLAGNDRTVRVAACESGQTSELLRVLGYRMRGDCGTDLVLETVNATRAFLTIDSGFPLAELEHSLRRNQPFAYDFRATRLPIRYGADYWLSSLRNPSRPFIDEFLADPLLCRFYLGMSRLDQETADALRSGADPERLRVLSHVLDFFGSMFQVRAGEAIVPGGTRSKRDWDRLVGVSPDRGGEFFARLISRDDGWMANYFDCLARADGPVQAYLSAPDRVRRFYEALRGRTTSPGPARPILRANPDLLLLTTRLRLESDGQPHIPGGLDVWKNLFVKPPSGMDRKALTRMAREWKRPEDLIESLFALTRDLRNGDMVRMYLALCDLNRHRTTPLGSATVERLTREYETYGTQYIILSEVPSLSDKTILQFLDAAADIDRIRSTELQAEAAGSMQALVGLWQILCRQESIPEPQADGVLSGILSRFINVRNPDDLFDSARAGVDTLLKAAGVGQTTRPQDQVMALLAGGVGPTDGASRSQAIQEALRIFEAQRLLSLNDLFAFADHMEELAAGGSSQKTELVNRLISRIDDIRESNPSLTGGDGGTGTSLASQRHIASQRRLNLRRDISRASGRPDRLRSVKGSMLPFLRDTLVGLNYIYYAPPGSQILLASPSFVRSHDVIGRGRNGQAWRSTRVRGSGWPLSAGGVLEGSLARLPYALASAEQDFMVPTREQALIWGDLAPQMILSAKATRWWNIAPYQVHWVALHMRYGESLFAEAVLDPRARGQLMVDLGRYAEPARVRGVEQLLQQGEPQAALERITPAELFALAAEGVRRQKDSSDVLLKEILRLAAESPEDVNYEAISRAFGTPKPALTHSYRPGLLHVRTFPALLGYSSRLMAETWESNILYWAALSDEMHIRPAQLDLLIPEWTQQMLERIFATHLEDWPALLHSMREVGESVRQRTGGQMARGQDTVTRIEEHDR